jgi:hypothetical protein
VTLKRFWAYRSAAAGLPGDGPVEEVELVGSVLHAVAEHVDHAALADLALQAVEELATRRTVVVEAQSVGSLDLRRPQEGVELGEINRRLAEVVAGVAEDPLAAVRRTGLMRVASRRRRRGLAGHPRDDQALEALLARLGGHASTSPAAPSRSISSSDSSPSSRASESSSSSGSPT